MRLIWSCLLAMCVAGGILAQDISGTIEGAILDQSGAAVPNAKVTITNTDRNQVARTITTDASGVYSAPLLPIGNYAIKVEAKGFKTDERKEIVLNVNDVLKINMRMEVGALTETVEISASAVQVELGSPASATTIDGNQVRELSLATRNYEQLVSLMPGVSNQNSVDELFVGTTGASGTTATIPYAVNGMRNSANNWTLDGADNVDRGSNQTLGSFPSIDAIAEFKVGRSTYTADSGRAGGAQINVVTKSGTSQYHGDIYEFFRNNALNSNNWANNANKVNWTDRQDPFTPCTNAIYQDCYAKQSAYRWNDFGGTFSGPVPLGHYNSDHNKTFFMYSEEAKRIINYTTYNPTLPVTDMLAGNFIQPVCITQVTSAGIVCPTGSAPVTQIPASQINPNAAAYIKDIFSKVPLQSGLVTANTTSGFFPEQILLNYREELVKVDQRFNDKFSMWAKFSNDSIPTTEPGGLFSCSTFPNGCTTKTNSPGRNWVIHGLGAFSPTLINEAGFNFTQSAITSTLVGLTAKVNNPDIHPVEPFANQDAPVPNLTFTGGTSLVGTGNYADYNRNYTFFDNFTWIRGRHTLRFGYSLNRYNKTENAMGQQGTFGFTNIGAPSGTASFQQSWANFLLGNVSTFSQASQDVTPDMWAWQHEAYAQDDFKVSPRLTLYYGVRWSFLGQPTDSNGELTSFDPALYSRANAPAIDPTTGNFLTPLANTAQALTNLAFNSNLGLIGGGKNSPFGSKIAPDAYHNFAPRVGLAWDPFGAGTTAIRVGYGMYYDSGLFGTYEQNIFANPPFVQSLTLSNASFSNIVGGTPNVITAPLALHATQLPANVPYSQQWNFTVEHRFTQDILVSVAYVGSKGTHLLGIVDINQAYPGAALAAGLHTTTGTGSNGPGTTVFTTADDPRINAVRPYYGWNAINALETAFDSNYHSLQVTLRKDFRRSGTLNAAYTWAKNLTDNASDRSNAPQNSYNYHEGEYGPYAGDRRQTLTLSYIYELPIFQSSHGVVGEVLKGWQLSGILSTYTGLPSTVTTSSVDPAGLGLLGSSAASSRPDMVCDPNANAPHTYAGSAQASAGNLLWFNTSCFAPVPQGAVRPGNAGRYTIRGPGFFNLDASLMKNFRVTERSKLQFRFETFNTMNWVNPYGFASTNITSTVFGEISAFRAPRRIQLALKFMF
ncbi:MAG TPA: carboxypeptidase regulatory-like domain-containing protein [Bryobacteraceae bacterium]|nr:carboxypeptidase regulatory-like domain-containing protein [Bryobacteraceae bacterium]